MSAAESDPRQEAARRAAAQKAELEDGDADTAGTPDIDALQADIEATREQLGETVDSLAAKLDVKGRTRARLQTSKQQATDTLLTVRDQAKDRATDENGEVHREVLIGAGVLAAATVALVVVFAVRRRNA